ncbi:MAG: hypothetical protein ABI037_12120 [Gemmatimonadales bacterium]
MRLNTLLLVAGLLALGFGLGFLLVPAAVLPVYGIQPDPATTLMSRFFGAALVQLGAALYLVRDLREAGTQRGLVLAGVVGSTAGLAVALMGQLSGVVNVMGWSTVAIYGLLLLGYGSHLRARPATV